jgi:hypothetical protein
MERHLRSTRPARPVPPAPARTGTNPRQVPSPRTEPDAAPAAAAMADTATFAHAARVLATEARRRGLVAPGFRSPPRLVGVDRSIRRHPGGAAVAVRVRNRPWVAVAADMIEGVIAANRLAPPRADRMRADLWSALGFAPAAAAPTPNRHAA